MLASLLATSSSLVAGTSPSSFLAATALRRAMSTSLLSSTPPAGLIKTPEALAKKLSLKNPSLLRFDNYINGSWVSSARAESTFDVNDPASDELIAQCPDLNADEVREAITAAEGARKSWAATSVKERSDLLLKLNAIIAENTEDLAKIISIENGKPLADAKGEIAYGNGYFDWFAGEALRSYGDTIPSATPGLRNIVIKQPVGVCSILACWNFPNAMITRKLAPALAAGCTAVIKAPPETPLSALALAALVEKAGFPKGVVNILTTNKNTVDVGYEMTTNPDVRKVSFTGSSPVGALLMKQASSTLKKCSFELGGNAIFAVFADADIPKAVDGLVASKFRLSGQTCVCANRIFIHEDVYDEFAKQFIAKVSAFKLGHPLEAGVTHGPVIHARAMAKTAKHVEDAVSKGATVALGGKPLPELGPHFYAPTVLLNVPLRGTLMEQEETFGPVAGLMKFKTEDELIERANDTPFGLAGYFFTQDLGRAFRVGEAIECGMVGINTGLISQTCIPFGGVKQSGFGREGSKYGLAEYQVTKLLAISIA